MYVKVKPYNQGLYRAIFLWQEKEIGLVLYIIIDFWREEVLYAIVLSIYAAFTWIKVMINLFPLSLEEGMVIIKDHRGCHFETTMGT